MEPTEHFGIYFGYIRRLFQSWVSPFNPRSVGVWLVTRPAGGGGKGSPPEISQTTGPISKFQTPFDIPVRKLPVQGQKFDPEVTDDVAWPLDRLNNKFITLI